MAWDKYKIRDPEIREELDNIFTGESEVNISVSGINLPEETPVNAVAATAELNLAATPTDGDTVTIGEKTYEFVDTLSEDTGSAVENEILIDGSANNAGTNLKNALEGGGTEGTDYSTGTTGVDGVSAAVEDGGSTVKLTADTKGTAAHSIELDETLSDASSEWDDTGDLESDRLAGGVDGTVGNKYDMYVDGSYLYVAVDDNTVSDDNWRRVSLGSAY